MEDHDRKPKRERSIPSTPEEMDSIVVTVDNTPPIKVEKKSSGIVHDASELSSAPVTPGGQTSLGTQTCIAQLSSASNISCSTEITKMDAKLDSFFEKLREGQVRQDEMIQSRLDMIDSSIKTFKPQPAKGSTTPTLKKLREQLKTEKDEHKDLKNKHKLLWKENDDLVQKYQELEEMNAELRDALAERDQQQLLLEGGSLANASKETDSTIAVLWTQLAYNIRNVAHLVAHSPGTQSLGDTVIHRLRLVTVNFRQFLSSQDHCIDLMQGYIWVLLRLRVFRVNQPLWGGLGSNYLKLAKECFYERITSVQNDSSEREVALANAGRHFSQMTAMLGELWDDDEALINSTINKEVKMLEPFFLQYHGRLDRADQKISEQLKDIFRIAIKLDKIMLTSKAFFECTWHDPWQSPPSIQLFNEVFMTSENHETMLTPKSRVLFFVSPILTKTGTADGQNYGDMMILNKAEVVCD
ncbi:hypothetical protein FLONG3_9260 [Fusarium longipes]|uniref:Uncharacterized protein n=1 Tax=Fusarium longipes TaxID=694270 RepID=A0A395RZ20_9HYPO|nr:hypothetical protein FLONG3_9260 [Fusarium longipes]